MASSSSDLMALIDEGGAEAEFKPYSYYGADEDALTIYWKGDADYAKRLNSRVTVFLSLDSDELVGCQIKSIRTVLEDIGWFDASIRHGKVRVDLLFLSLHATFDGEDARQLYRKLGEIVAGSGMEVAIPELCAQS